MNREFYYPDRLSRHFERISHYLKNASASRRLRLAVKNNPFAYSLVEHGIRTAAALKRPRQLKTYLATGVCRKLNVGSGADPIPGWINADLTPWRKSIVYMDATKPLPLPTASMNFVFTEHMIEHIAYDDARAFLREAFRVLRAGGRIRIATPDLDRILTLKTDPPSGVQRAYVAFSNRQYGEPDQGDNPAFAINRTFREWGHQFIYDYRTLRDLLVNCGFDQVHRCNVGESEHPELIGLERHGREIGDSFNVFETLVVEASKPLLLNLSDQ
jgi:predicted SAM-dependent methyltransferase